MEDLCWGGPIFQMVRSEIDRFAPDVVISDSEAWTHRVARKLEIGRISFDHYGIMAYCRIGMTPLQRLIADMESLVYRMIVCKPDRIIAAAFYPGKPRRKGVNVVGAILRKEVRQMAPTNGDYLLTYCSNADIHFTEQVEEALKQLDCPVLVYGPKRTGTRDNLEFRPISNQQFIKDLAGCKAVFSTAGNQLISEAIHFGKPLLLIPEQALEQRLNARFVENWNIGMQTKPKRVTPDLLREFLSRNNEFRNNIHAYQRDGVDEALQAIDSAIEELCRRPTPESVA